MQQKIQFYDRYHQKNHQFAKVIKRLNFTYFYILEWLHSGEILGQLGGVGPKSAVAQKSQQPLKVLDVGCGVGTISLYLASLGCEVTGLDVSVRAINLAKQAQRELGFKNVKFVRGVLDGHKESNDVITCFEVIEHIENDEVFAKQLAAKLKKKGYLLLSTPSLENFLYNIGFYQKFDQEVGHVRRYTPTKISAVLKKAGFKIIRVQTHESILRNLLFTTKLGIVIKFIKGPLIPLFHKIDEAMIPIFGASDIIVLAQKV